MKEPNQTEIKDDEEFTEFMKKLKEDSRTYFNFSSILEKAEKDGYIISIQSTLHKIFQQEMTYAVFGLIIRTGQNPSQE